MEPLALNGPNTDMTKISLDDKFKLFTEEWTPKVIAKVNGQLVKLAKASGEMVWHSHEAEDELFFVHRGRLTLMMRDREVVLGPGELFVVPKGVEHCPRAEPGTEIMLVESASCAHTGVTESDMTVANDQQEWI